MEPNYWETSCVIELTHVKLQLNFIRRYLILKKIVIKGSYQLIFIKRYYGRTKNHTSPNRISDLEWKIIPTKFQTLKI